MRKTATTLLLLLLPVLAEAQVYGPEGVNMVGQIQNPDWQNPPPQSGLVMSFDTQPGGVGTYKSGVLLAGSNIDAGANLEWLFTSGPTGGEYNNTWKDVSVVMNTPQTYTWQGGGNDTVSPVSGRYYVVRFLDSGYNNTQGVWSELTAAPVTLSLGAPQANGANTTVTVNLSAPVSSEGVYVRYSTDNYASSAVAAASCGGTATCTASIPNAGSPSYYAFTATGGSAPTGAEAAVRTINNTSPSTLPVELTAFAGVVDGARARLSWTTASETNNAGFAVEQQQGQAWAQVGFVAGQGTTSEARTYTCSVTGLAAGTYAFRLRQVDFDGAAHYSPVVEVAVNEGDALRLTAQGRRVVVAVREAQAGQVRALRRARAPRGRRCSTANCPGTQTLALPEALPAGTYVVRALGARTSSTLVIGVR